ncbi:MAG: PilZ domain-containing protein [Thermodesulfobacteriota bacterium]
MKDTYKTKAQLITELDRARRQIGELRSELDALKSKKKTGSDRLESRPPRQEIRTHVEFIADFDVIEARGINISEGGICFELDEDLPFEMRFELDGKLHQHRANLVWVKRSSGGGYLFGLMFVRPQAAASF